LKFEESVEFEILPEGLLLRPVHKQTSPGDAAPRAGWKEMFAAAQTVDDDLEEFTDWNEASLTAFDREEW
jgi:hypothetical protein